MYDGTTFNQIPGSATEIDVRGENVVIIGTDNIARQWDFSQGVWVDLGGKTDLQKVAVTQDGLIFGVDSSGNIYKYKQDINANRYHARQSAN